MSYRLKRVQDQTYAELGIETFREAQLKAIAAATVSKADVIIINEDNDDVLATAVYNQADDVHLILSNLGLKDSPWI